MKRRVIIVILLCLAILVLLIGWHRHASDDSSTTTPPPSSPTNQQPATTPPNSGFNKQTHSLTATDSIWVVVNKQRPLNPKSYVPDTVVPSIALKGSASAQNMHVAAVMAPALQTMVAAAATDNVHLMLSSGYRSYTYQVTVYNRIVKSQGTTAADTQSARPGYSEHQTGLAADLAPTSGKCDLQQCFGQTPEGKWLVANAYKYGFIIRYPADKQAVTGYEYEPWHVRYIGVDLSTEMHRVGSETLEEFFNLGAAPDYS